MIDTRCPVQSRLGLSRVDASVDIARSPVYACWIRNRLFLQSIRRNERGFLYYDEKKLTRARSTLKKGSLSIGFRGIDLVLSEKIRKLDFQIHGYVLALNYSGKDPGGMLVWTRRVDKCQFFVR
jgi:hypothetical protein